MAELIQVHGFFFPKNDREQELLFPGKRNGLISIQSEPAEFLRWVYLFFEGDKNCLIDQVEEKEKGEK